MFICETKIFGSSTILTMVHFLAISILLIPIVTATGEDFWDDVDMIDNDLYDPDDMPTLSTIIEDQLIEPTPDAPQYFLPSRENEENLKKRRGPSTVKFSPKFVTLRPADVQIFKKTLIIDDSAPQNLSLTILDHKLLALGSTHEWHELKTYEVDRYSKYWAKVCVTLWDQPLEEVGHRIACIVSRSYASNKWRSYQINQTKHRFDFLCCRCYTYLSNSKVPLSTPETSLIHKGNENEFFIFEINESDGKLSIKGFKNGITLTNPRDSERSSLSSRKFIGKKVTLSALEIDMFNIAITISSYPQNVSLEKLEEKLSKHEEIHEWSDLLKYDYEKFTRYWGKVCVYFWGKQLDRSHRQACILSPSLGDSKIRKLFVQNETKYLDLLYCKCHSYITNMKTPVFKADTFLIHENSANEYFVFTQQPTEHCKYTLFIKDFKGGITLPNPDDYN